MTGHFVALGCTSCGAKLDVYDGVERFTCGYCGTEMIVERHGAEVSLHGLADMLREVRAGSEKTAAEMALARYTKELDQLRYEQAARVQFATRRAGNFGLFAVFSLVWGLVLLFTAGWFGFLGLGLAGFLAKKAWEAVGQKNDPWANTRIWELQQLIEKKERIANS